MRKLIVCNIISLDGFYSGPGGDVMAMPFDAGFSDYNAERLRAADTLLLGRTSYEDFRSYWPTVAEDESQPAVDAFHKQGAQSPIVAGRLHIFVRAAGPYETIGHRGILSCSPHSRRARIRDA
jgi:hypothetical protein